MPPATGRGRRDHGRDRLLGLLLHLLHVFATAKQSGNRAGQNKSG
jgi:hypothetical protein